jgi:hypothetical protein
MKSQITIEFYLNNYPIRIYQKPPEESESL